MIIFLRKMGSKVLKKRMIVISPIILFLISSLIIYFCNAEIDKASTGKIFSSTELIPQNHIGLLLGTSKYLKSGNLNPYYSYRIDAATELFQAGKIKYIIISGDNSRQDYNEPEEMKADLLEKGIDSTKIYLDYAGFRTFDSVVRLKEIFGQTSATIISQQFHNERAIFIASKEGISAIGFNAADVGQILGFKVQIREKLARVKVFVDYLTGQKPKFLGDQILIP